MTNASTATKRFYDIDAARSAVMFVALFIHAGLIYAPSAPHITNNVDRLDFFSWLTSGLHLFISPTFFVVGGFFTALLITRYGYKKFLLKRCLRAGIPLLLIALSLNQIESYLRYIDSTDSLISEISFSDYLGSEAHMENWKNGNWQLHTWFLVQLILSFLVTTLAVVALQYTPRISQTLTCVLEHAGKRFKTHVGYISFLACLPLLQIFATGIASIIDFGYEVHTVGPVGISSIYRFALFYMVFLVGSAMYVSPSIYEAVTKWRSWMPLAAAMSFYIQFYPSKESDGIAAIAEWYAHYLGRWVLILFVLQFFHRFFHDRPSKTTIFMSDASMTFYLFHHCFVYALGRLFVDISFHPILEWGMICALITSSLMIFHHFLISPYVPMRFLFNGQTDIPKIMQTKRKETGLN